MFASASAYLDALFLLLGDNSERSRSIVKDFLAAADKQEGKRDITTFDDDLVSVYRGLIKMVIAENISQENETASKMLLLRVKGNEVLKSHPVENGILTDILTGSEQITAEQIDQYLRKIRNALVVAEIDATARRAMAMVRQISENTDVQTQESETHKIQMMLDTAQKSIEARRSTTEVKASESYVSLSDPESITRALTTFMERSVTGILRSGLQGLNKSLGSRGGVGRGESMVFFASSHNYKTGMLVSWLIWIAVYNVIKVTPGKKPLLYFVSLENEVNQNLMDVFRTLYGRIENKPVDINSLSVEDIKEWLVNFFAQFDIEVIIDRFSPHDFSFRTFVDRYNKFCDMNFEMVAFILDYMSEARGVDPGDTLSTQGTIQLIKENYTKFSHHAKSCGYTMITGHQLTKEAEKVAGSTKYPVKKFHPGMIADSSDVHRIVDVFFFLQLEKNMDDHKFLTCINKKNRYCKDTPERDKFFAYPFTEFGIQDDLLGPPQYIQDIDLFGGHNAATDTHIVEAAMF